MARGSLAGIVSGVVVSGLALGVASLSLPQVDMGGSPPASGADTPVVIAPEGADAPGQDTTAKGMDGADSEPATAPEADKALPEAPEAGDMPEAAQQPADSEAAPEATPAPTAGDDTGAEPLTGDETGADPASAPTVGAAGANGADGADGVQEVDDTPKRGEAAEADLTPQPTGTSLPETDRAPQMEVDPVKEPMTDPDEPVAIPGTELVEKLPPALPPTSGDEASGDVEPDATEPAAAEPAAAEPDAAMPDAAMPDSTEPGTTEPGTTDTAVPTMLPDTSDDKAAGSALVVEPEPEAEPTPKIATIVAEPAPKPAPVVVAPAPAPEPAPEPEPAPKPGLSGADTVVVGRLPTIGDEPKEETPEVTDPETPDPAALAALPAIERNGIAFDVEGDQPLLGLLLLDTGDRAALEDIGKLPFPLTVAVDAGAPDAAEAIDFYATRGIEVALLLPLPDGATPSDVDVTVQAYGPLLAQAAEVVVDPEVGFQALGPGAVQLATNLSESGHGLVSFPSGLNTGHKAAEKQGVPAGLVFLDLDGDAQGGPVIRRFLDNAAFRARNETGVIVLARTRAETLQALLEWSLGNRAQSVTLAPISAVLLKQ